MEKGIRLRGDINKQLRGWWFKNGSCQTFLSIKNDMNKRKIYRSLNFFSMENTVN